MSSKLISTVFAIFAFGAHHAHAQDANSANARDTGIAQAPVTNLPVANTSGASSSLAKDSGQTMFKFGGFGTLGVSHSSENRGDYVLDRSAPDGAGRSHDWATGNDTRLGIQVFADLAPQIKAVLQVETEYDSDGTYNPHVEWANVKYAFSPNLNVRVGRIALQTFLNSDNRDVGYSYPWVHPPIDLYHQLSISHSDGVDGSYRFFVEDVSNVIKAIYGRSKNEYPHSTSTSKNLWGIFDTVEYGATTFRIGYQARETSSFFPLTGVTSAWVRNSDLSAGAIYDPGKWFVTSEWIQRKSNTKEQSKYISTGYRIEHFTPYLAYSKDSPSSFLSDNPPPTARAIQSAKDAQSTASLGTRWDFMKDTDLKLQYDRVKLSADSNGNLINVPVGTILYGATFHVISATVDFIF